MTTCYIALGSNLDDPVKQITTAFQELAAMDQCQLLACSSLWSSKPVGPQDQPDYVNATVALETILLPEQLLDALQALERAHHRIKTRHWGERTLDLDILSYGDINVSSERLTIPHPQMIFRSFVLLPLAEIAPTLVIAGQTIADRAKTIDRSDIYLLK